MTFDIYENNDLFPIYFFFCKEITISFFRKIRDELVFDYFKYLIVLLKRKRERETVNIRLFSSSCICETSN